MKLLLDENVPVSYIKELKKMGHDVEHINQYCKDFGDNEVLYYALKKKRMIITFDSDFCNFRKKEHYGIIKIDGKNNNPLQTLIKLLKIIKEDEIKDTYYQIDKNKIYKERKILSRKKHFQRTPIFLENIQSS